MRDGYGGHRLFPAALSETGNSAKCPAIPKRNRAQKNSLRSDNFAPCPRNIRSFWEFLRFGYSSRKQSVSSIPVPQKPAALSDSSGRAPCPMKSNTSVTVTHHCRNCLQIKKKQLTNRNIFRIMILFVAGRTICDSSTVGSTPPCQGGGRGFEPRLSLYSICERRILDGQGSFFIRWENSFPIV